MDEAPFAMITANTLQIWAFSPIILCKILGGLSVDGNVSRETFDWVQVRYSLKDIHRVVPNLLLRCLGRLLRVIVLLEAANTS